MKSPLIDPSRLHDLRRLVLRFLWIQAAGTPGFEVSGETAQHALSMTRKEMSAVIRLLGREALLAHGQAHCIGLNAAGLRAAESLEECRPPVPRAGEKVTILDDQPADVRPA